MLSASLQTQPRRAVADEDRTEGTEHQIKGAIKENVGKVAGSVDKQMAGNFQKNAGKMQKAVGEAADNMRAEDEEHH